VWVYDSRRRERGAGDPETRAVSAHDWATAGRRLPDYLLVSYDRPRSVVVLAEFIDGESLVLERLKARAPLGAGARRAGWVGATLDLAGLERHAVVGPSFSPEIESWRGDEV